MFRLYFYMIFVGFICFSCSKAEIYHKKANQLEEQGQYVAAIAYLDKAIEEKPTFVDAYLDRAVDYFSLGDYKKSIGDYTAVLFIDSLNVLAYNNRANNYRRINLLEEAYKDIQKAYILTNRENSSLVVRWNSNSFFDVESDKYGVELSEILFNRGLIYFEMDSLNLAYYDMSSCLDVPSLAREAYYWRGIINLKLGKKDSGCEDLHMSMLRGDKDAREASEKYCK